jgi:hypothetical protein
LQTVALPLGYAADKGSVERAAQSLEFNLLFYPLYAIRSTLSFYGAGNGI